MTRACSMVHRMLCLFSKSSIGIIGNLENQSWAESHILLYTGDPAPKFTMRRAELELAQFKFLTTLLI